MTRGYDHLMLDLETLGTDRHSAILQIGACMFSMERGVSHDNNHRFCISIDPASCQDYGLVIDPRTVMWWMRGAAEEETFRNAIRSMKPIYDLPHALRAFDTFWRTMQPEHIWSCGSDFDVPILEHAWRKVGNMNGAPPWKYWQIRDVRTLRWLGGTSKRTDATDHHNALGDAVRQAEEMARAWSRINTPHHHQEPQDPDVEGS